MYHVTGTGLTIIILYLISYFFYRSGFYSLQFHRKLWNSILAAAFMVTALAGLFLALQVTYKWDIPGIKTLLKWHVETGISMAVTGLFHFLWHSTYFLRLFRRQEKPSEKGEPAFLFSAADIQINLFIVGFISSSVQLLLLREVMNITGGYEMVAGTYLCAWLTGSAAGSALAAGSDLTDLRRINLHFAAGPVYSLILLIILSRLFLKPGETPSFFIGILFICIVLLPFCIISGFTFIKLVSAGRRSNLNPGKSFSIETTGGILAGIFISFISSGILNTYKSLILIILLGSAYPLLRFFINGTINKNIFRSVILTFSVILILSSPDKFFRQLQLRGIKVSETIDTPYGNITKGFFQNDTCVFYNQRLLIYSNDIVESEEDIHYAMLQADSTRSILQISGPISSRFHEIEKYNVKNVVYVERDPRLAEMENPIYQRNSSVLKVENDDAFTYVKRTSEKFDVVLMLLPPPSSLSLNRYYTTEFFACVKEKMGTNGIFSCSPGINTNYFNKESIKLYSSVYNSLRSVFRNVIPVAGNKLYLIASDKELSVSVCELVRAKKLVNVYVGPDYLSDEVIASKSNEITALIDKKVKNNSTMVPVASFFYQSFTLSKDANETIPALILLLFLFIFSISTIKPDNSIMYFSSFALSGFEISLLLVLQITLGNMYQVTGLILGGVMAGLAVGAANGIPSLTGRSMSFKIIFLVTFYIASGLAFGKIVNLSNHFLVTALLILSGFIPSLITGSFFTYLTGNDERSYRAHSVYSADLAGSAIGFMLFTWISVPVLGIRFSILLMPVLVLAGYLFAFKTSKH